MTALCNIIKLVICVIIQFYIPLNFISNLICELATPAQTAIGRQKVNHDKS
jgi:hypothetical protein